MAVRSKPTGAASSSQSSGAGDRRGRDHSDIKCFNCNQMGHSASKCSKPDRRDKESQSADSKS